MLNKNCFVILVFLLVILQVSFVSAQSDNQTGLINESLEITNDYSQNFETDNYSDNIELYQGDIIPIHIDSPSDGGLKVLVDDREYGVWNFTKNDTIYIPTYNPKSFYNNSKINIDVGLHNISLIFNFRNIVSKDVNIFSDENSTLNFKFNKNYYSYITTYPYNFTLNILKKDKTIHILNFTYNNLCEDGEYIIHMDNYDLWCERGMNDEIYGDGNICRFTRIDGNESVSEVVFEEFRVDKVGDFWLYEVGVYNFTIINILDGTWDSLLFKLDKYQPNLDIIPIVNGTNLTINITIPLVEYYKTWASISIDNITKNLLINGEFGVYIEQVVFENLTSGVHILSIYCPEDYASEEFYYTKSFEIEEVFNLDDRCENTINQINVGQNYSNDTNLSFIEGNITSGDAMHLVDVITSYDDNNFYSTKNNSNLKETIFYSVIGDDGVAQSNSNSQSKKSFEVIKKSNSKTIDEIKPFYLIVIVFILLLIGYFKFGEKI